MPIAGGGTIDSLKGLPSNPNHSMILQNENILPHTLHWYQIDIS